MKLVKSWKIGSVILSLLFLTGCAARQEQSSPREAAVSKPAPVVNPQQEMVQASYQEVKPTGSLYNASYGHFLFSDRRAYRLGDILTVTLDGGDTVSMGGGTTNRKNNTINIPDPTILGKSSASILGEGRSLAFNFAPERTYGGATGANRNNSLDGSIAVKVIDVLRNGSLRVQGEKWLTVNNNRELVRITGLVRPEDINTNNEVSSVKLAESKLDYVAVGGNADIHEPGWMTKVLNSPWFPF